MEHVKRKDECARMRNKIDVPNTKNRHINQSAMQEVVDIRALKFTGDNKVI